jgi:hypothetical protein
MRILVLICFTGMSLLSVQAQKDPVQLVDIQSSECGGMYYVKPTFISRKTIGDTTFIRLSCTNNCGGYHDPGIEVSGDSVFISIHAGEKSMKPSVYYKVNGEIYSEDNLIARERRYDKKYSRSDTVLVMEEVITEATCSCCFTFDLKIIGLDPDHSYKYFYNNTFIDPNDIRTGNH